MEVSITEPLMVDLQTPGTSGRLLELPVQTEYEQLFKTHYVKSSRRKKYRRTVVLLTYWTDSDLEALDDALEQEVKRLEHVFHASYNFKTSIFKIPDKRPQARLHNAFSNFVSEYGEKDTLLIVYYAGHGFYDKDEHKLYLIKKKSSRQDDLKEGSIEWLHVESALYCSDGDVIGIFDCCHAGALTNNRAPNRFEYLGACGPNDITPGPGSNSFTSALIDALEWFRAHSPCSFNLAELQNQIMRDDHFPRHQKPSLGHAHGLPSRDHIVIEPQPEQKDLSSQDVVRGEIPDGHYDMVDIRFSFDGKIDQTAFIAFAKSLGTLGTDHDTNIALRNVQFISKRTYTRFVSFIVTGNVLFNMIVRRRIVHRWWRMLDAKTKCHRRWRQTMAQAKPIDEWIGKLRGSDRQPVAPLDAEIQAQARELSARREPDSLQQKITVPSNDLRYDSPLLDTQSNRLATPVDTDDQMSVASSVAPSNTAPCATSTNLVPASRPLKRKSSTTDANPGQNVNDHLTQPNGLGRVTKVLRPSNAESP